MVEFNHQNITGVIRITREWIIAGAKVYGEERQLENGYIKVAQDQITEVGCAAEVDPALIEGAIQLPASWKVVPGMIDVHIHGAAGADTMDATEEALEIMSRALPAEGTTAFLATTMTQDQEAIERALKNAAVYIEGNNKVGKAEVLGIHLEGPFISAIRAGAQPPGAIRLPDVTLFQRWQELAGGAIRLVTLAPEQEGGLEFAAYLKQTGVVASIGHSDATYEQTVQAIQAGVTHATHLYNGMRGMHHREPGVVGAVLLRDEIKVEMIVDGVHACPEMIDLAYRLKRAEGIILVTDAMRAKCLGDGHYTLGGQDVQVEGGKAVLEDGTLAGSIIKMKDAAWNMMSYTKCTLEDVIRMTAENPARQLGFWNRKGSLRVGKDADLVVLDEQMNVRMTFCRGTLAYQQ
ncbi:N-acetylglucosamine-6-phosphate deacetylase [Ammoniphilus sp. YIM 78166]|uniref:N-acetylglucosamine-6-phosphate deacetylase n=1 Tax=Ammoniphilus sp. YIM 78166 TaxID=1644106 RepID=UPI00106F7EC0|nr:N-acetylglucosamine-6-phosphate deacetylase [Ammoniphilus sp. YIM 78166]